MSTDYRPWIGVDLDGTLAEYHGWTGNPLHVGAPIPAMVDRVRGWLAEGKDVRIFTARVDEAHGPEEVIRARQVIRAWCREHLGTDLPITNVKDYQMVALYDDRAVQVERNTGRILGDEEAAR